jgi:hypothetical protein
VQDHRRWKLDAERLVAVTIQDDVNDVLVEEGASSGRPASSKDFGFGRSLSDFSIFVSAQRRVFFSEGVGDLRSAE